MTIRLFSLVASTVLLLPVLYVAASEHYWLAVEVFTVGILIVEALSVFSRSRSGNRQPITFSLSQYARSRGVGRHSIETRSPPIPVSLFIRKLVATVVLSGVLGGGGGFLLAGNEITAAAIFIAAAAGALAVKWGGDA